MQNENVTEIETLNQLNENICALCQEYMYDSSLYYMTTFNKIRNASMLLLNNAMRIYRHQSSLITSGNQAITIKQTKELMFKIYQIMLDIDFPLIKEKKLKKIIKNDFQIDPQELLQPDLSPNNEQLKVTKILNGDID